MTRAGGFAHANLDTSFLDDPKLRALRRRVGVQRSEHCVVLYLALVLESWRSGRRMKVNEAVQDWQDVDEDDVRALRAVGLVDRTERIPKASWDGWYGAAAGRREQLREAGRKGGLKGSLKGCSSDATPMHSSHTVIQSDSHTRARKRSSPSPLSKSLSPSVDSEFRQKVQPDFVAKRREPIDPDKPGGVE